MGDRKNLLPFLWAYAISKDFHSPKRFKYHTSITRNMRVMEQLIIDNDELKANLYNPVYRLSLEEITLFRPFHDVFGHQNSIEASDNSKIFQTNYNRSIDGLSFYSVSFICIKDENGICLKDQNNNYIASWEKEWRDVIPKNSSGKYVTKEVALWLWKRFIGDNGKNFGPLEEAHIVALLNGKDLSLLLDETGPLIIYDLNAITNDNSVKQKLQDASVAIMNLDSSDIKLRRDADYRVGTAIAFIAATPYIFAQEGM